MTMRSGFLVVGLLAGWFALGGCGSPAPSESAETVSAADDAEIRAVLARIEEDVEAGDLEAMMTVFSDDAQILSQGMPDVVGKEAIHELYAGAMADADLHVDFDTREIEVFGDRAYERGNYTLRLTDKSTGDLLAEQHNRHIHIFRRNPDGEWQTWRMVTNSAKPPPVAE